MNTLSSCSSVPAAVINSGIQAGIASSLSDMLATAMKVAAIFFVAAVCKSVMSFSINDIFDKLNKISYSLGKLGEISSEMTKIADGVIKEATSIAAPIGQAVSQLNPPQAQQNQQLFASIPVAPNSQNKQPLAAAAS